MKDFNKEIIERATQHICAADLIESCLNKLYKDDKHVLNDAIVDNLQFLHIFDTLLKAKKELKFFNDYVKRLNLKDIDELSNGGVIKFKDYIEMVKELENLKCCGNCYNLVDGINYCNVKQKDVLGYGVCSKYSPDNLNNESRGEVK